LLELFELVGGLHKNRFLVVGPCIVPGGQAHRNPAVLATPFFPRFTPPYAWH
jgi:hypothetical protein